MCGSGGGMNIYSAAQLSALTRLFSATVFREMAKKGRSGLFRRLIDQTDLIERAYPRATVGDTFDSAFDILKVAGHRAEYLYRAAISHKVLIVRKSVVSGRSGSVRVDIGGGRIIKKKRERKNQKD